MNHQSAGPQLRNKSAHWPHQSHAPLSPPLRRCTFPPGHLCPHRSCFFKPLQIAFALAMIHVLQSRHRTREPTFRRAQLRRITSRGYCACLETRRRSATRCSSRWLMCLVWSNVRVQGTELMFLESLYHGICTAFVCKTLFFGRLKKDRHCRQANDFEFCRLPSSRVQAFNVRVAFPWSLSCASRFSRHRV